MKHSSLDGLTILRFMLDPQEIGGAALDVEILDRTLARRQPINLHKVFLTARSTTGWTETVGASTITYHPVGYDRQDVGRNKERIVNDLEDALGSIVRRHRPDLIANHVPEISAGVMVCRFAKQNDIPLFIQLHGGEMPRMRLPHEHRRMLDEVVDQFTRSARMADAVTAVSDSADRLIEDRSVTNLWTGADPRFYDPRSIQAGYLRDRFDIYVEHPIIVLPARIVIEKGHKILLDALQLLFNKAMDFRVFFVGSATRDMREQLDDYILRNGFSGVVHNIYDATQDQMRAIYRDADVVTLPGYHFEGCPRCLLESQLMETPVVASDSGGTRESFIDGETGFLFPVGDHEALAKVLEPLLLDASLRERMGRAGRRHVMRRFDLDALARRHEAVYRRLAERPVAVSA